MRGSQVSSGVLRESASSVRETVVVVEPYPENWFCRVSTAVASEEGTRSADGP